MAIERKLISFDGGMQDVPDTKPLNSPDEIINYEELQKGILEKRRDPVTFETLFDTAVRTAFNVDTLEGNIIDYAPEPFYPANLPSDMAEGYDYLIPVYGNIGGSPSEYKLYLFYKNNSGTWVYKTTDGVNLLQGIVDDGVVFTANSKLRFSYDKNLLYIVDDVNNLFFITTDDDGNVVSAKCGISASKSIPIITAMDGWEDRYFEEYKIGDGIGDVGLIRVIYNCSTKEGHKNNPSPASEFADFQWIKLDTGSRDRWLKRFQVTNVKVPDNINSYIKGELKYFDFYFEIFLHSEGLDTKSFEFSCRKEIFDKDGANSYTIAVPSSATILADWENDIAPVAKDLVAFDGKVVLAQVKDRLKFPFEFDNIWRIKLNNQDNRTYVDGVIRIRLYDKDATSDPDNGIYPIENFTVSYYCDNTNILHNSKIRIYDTDLTTPIMVDYIAGMSKKEGDNQYIDLFIKIPQLQAGSIHTLYLCFGGEGVPSKYNQLIGDDLSWSGSIGIHYGRFWHLNWDWRMQQVFKPRKGTDENCLVCSPMDEKDWADEDKIPNKANTENNGNKTGCGWSGDEIAFLPSSGHLIGKDSVLFNNSEHNNVKFGKIDIGNTDNVKASIYVKINTDNLANEGQGVAGSVTENIIFGNYVSENDRLKGWVVGIKVPEGTSNAYMEVILGDTNNNDNIQRVLFDGVDLDNLSDPTINLFILVRINFDLEKVYLFVYEKSDGLLINEEKSFSFTNGYYISDNMEITLGEEGNVFDVDDETYMIHWSIKQIKYDQFLYETKQYGNDINEAQNIANFMPAFSEMIGYKYFDTDTASYSGNDVQFIHNDGDVHKIILIIDKDVRDLFPLDNLIKIETESGFNDRTYTILDVQLSTGVWNGTLIYLTNGLDLTAEDAGQDVSLYCDSHNKNITFEKVDNSLKAKNILRWSKKGGFAFPDTYYKSGIPTPIVRIVRSLSTLALQSQNVIKIYLRNGLYKFIAKGDPSTWADLSDNLIQQNKRFGLLQQDALAETPYGEFHLSEAGIVQWQGDVLKIVTNIRTEEGEYPIINIPLDKVYIMFYCSIRQQLFLQEKYEEKYLVDERGYFLTTNDGKRIKLKL